MTKSQREITVLITGIGGPTTRGLAKSLKKLSSYGCYRIVGTDTSPLAIGLYDKNYVDAAYVVPPVFSDKYWGTIKRIVELEKVDIALVQTETEVEEWALYGQENELPCPTLLPPVEFILSVRDKARMFELLSGTDLVPQSIRATRAQLSEGLGDKLNFPFWIRASKGAGAIGSLKVNNQREIDAWLVIQSEIEEFTASEFLPGRNFACKMLYRDGELIRSACAQRVEYFRAEVAPSGVSGLTAFGRLINNKDAFDVSVKCVEYLCTQLGIVPHGFMTVDLKEDSNGCPKVTEINVRHVSFTVAFTEAGVNLAEDMVQLMLGHNDNVNKEGLHHFDEQWIFLRHVDSEMVVIKENNLLSLLK